MNDGDAHAGRRLRRAAWAWPLLSPLVAFCCGCPLPSGVDANQPDSGPKTLPALDQGGNNSLTTATPLTFDTSGELRFAGAIEGITDIDVYRLGVLRPGDGLYVDVRRTGGDLDPVAAIFDTRQYLVAFSDDRDPSGSNLNPLIDIVIRGQEGEYFLGIIAYPDIPSSGNYEVTVVIERNLGVPSPQPQTVFLDWDGGENIVIPNVGEYDLKPFSATDVGFSAAQTEALKDRVQQIVADRYRGFNLMVLNSDDHPEPSTPHSTVYFGGADFRAFAISEKIDTFNQDPWDKTIIFVQGYQGAFQKEPTFEEMAQALGNTIAHEVGHLLGLVHTADCDDLMDTSCFNDRLLTPQEFTTAQLDYTVFPFGYQAAREILGWLLGLVGL